MPIDSKLQFSTGNTYTGPYPRPKDSIWYILRTVLLLCWAIILYYLGNAGWNFYYTDYSKPKSLSSLKDFLDALVIPNFMRDQNAPLGLSTTFALLFVLVLVGCIWATRDWKREQEIVQAIKKNQKDDKSSEEDLTKRDRDKQLSKPQGPPFDIENPFHPSEIVGRTEEIAWLLKRLRAGKINRVTALWGLAGIGKTVLVIEALRKLYAEKRFKDGMAVISCQGIKNVEEVLQRIIMRFDPHNGASVSSDSNELKEDIDRLFYGKNALIVLENVEPAFDIKEMLAYLYSAKDITILLTARHMLSQIVDPLKARRRLAPLSAIESLDLFAQSFGESVNDPEHIGYSIAKNIVKKLGSHPFAIRIVGDYAKSCGRDLATLEKELNKNLKDAFEIADNNGKPGAVRLAFETSTKEHDALPPEARKLFLALTAFTDIEFSRAAVVVLANHLNAGISVDLLVRRGLVDAYVNESMPEQSHRERQQLQPLMRAFAEESFGKWQEAERKDIRRILASFYADYSSEVAVEALSYDEINIMGALDWACEQHEDALVAKLCSEMQYFWVSYSRLEDSQKYLPMGIKAVQAIIAQTENEGDSFRLATLQQTYGQILQKVGQDETAKKNFDEALTFFQQKIDQRGKYESLVSLGEIAQQRGELKEAERYYRQSLTILRVLQEEQNKQSTQKESETLALYQQNEGEILISLGELAQQRGRLREAEGYSRQSLSILRETGSSESQIHDFIHLGEIAQYRGQKGEAERHFEDALTITHQIYDRRGESVVLAHMADLALAFNQTKEANNCCQKALAIAREVQHRRCECWMLSCKGRLSILAKGKPSDAEKQFKDALKLAKDIQDKREESRINIFLGDLAQARGLIEKAEMYYRTALAIADTFQDAIVYAEVALKLGAFLIEHNLQSKDKPDEGCVRIREAIQLYSSMKLPNEQEARRIWQQVGCKDDNKETILIR